MSAPTCPQEARLRTVLAGAPGDDAAWEWAERHVARCFSCGAVVVEHEAPLEDDERAVLTAFLNAAQLDLGRGGRLGHGGRPGARRGQVADSEARTGIVTFHPWTVRFGLEWMPRG